MVWIEPRLQCGGSSLTVVRCPTSLLPALVEVTAGAHEAAHHGGNDGYKQQDGRGNPKYGVGAEVRRGKSERDIERRVGDRE